MSEVPVSGLISVARAMAIIDSTSVTPRTERVNLDLSLHHRLAETVVADRDDPPFDKSQMDGFAIRVGDRSPLTIVGDIPAGTLAKRALAAGEAMSIMTGAPLPAGADAVIPLERVERHDDAVRLKEEVPADAFIARRGSDCTAGSVILNAGTWMGPAQIAVAASAGRADLLVFSQPRVAILSTGDEVVPLDASPRATQIRDTNSPMLSALLTSLGCVVTDMGISPDDPRQLRARLDAGLALAEVMFVTGGMSMGTYDYVPQMLLEMGFESKIGKLRIKPGKPFVFATRREAERDQFVFGLPGNPVSSFVCTLRLASRLLARLAGGEPVETWSMGKLEIGLPANGPREFYHPVKIERRFVIETSLQTNLPAVRPLAWKASSDIYTLAAADGFLVRGEYESSLPQGTDVNVLMVGGQR